MLAIGEDPDRPGLAETPARWARWWREFVGYDAGNTDTVFEPIETDQMVIVRNIRVWSLCEHHLLPFYCDVSIGYLTGAKLVGLSKFGRIAHRHAHALQTQERLIDEIARDVARVAETENVAVVAVGEHLCMTMRGIRSPHRMVSSVVRGAFSVNPSARQEFLSLAGVWDKLG